MDHHNILSLKKSGSVENLYRGAGGGGDEIYLQTPPGARCRGSQEMELIHCLCPDIVLPLEMILFITFI